MTPAVLTVGNAMHRALSNLPCRCAHNVLYTDCPTKQTATAQCQRCKSMAMWEALVLAEAA